MLLLFPPVVPDLFGFCSGCFDYFLINAGGTLLGIFTDIEALGLDGALLRLDLPALILPLLLGGFAK